MCHQRTPGFSVLLVIRFVPLSGQMVAWGTAPERTLGMRSLQPCASRDVTFSQAGQRVMNICPGQGQLTPIVPAGLLIAPPPFSLLE